MDMRRIVMGTFAGKAICALAVVLWLAAFSLAGQESSSTSKANSAGSFDAPIKKVTVDLGISPKYPGDHVRDTLSCYYFPNLMIKQYDEQGNIGAVWMSMLRSRGTLPPCKPAHEPGEKVIQYPEWEGDFWGVKGKFAFFSCAEFEQGDCNFVVYDSTTRKRVFLGDVAVSDKDQDIHMQVYSTKAGVVARYVAAINAGCDVYAKGTACWKKVKAKLGLKSDPKPVCKGYPQVYKTFQTDEDDSMIGYPVEVTFSSRTTVKTVAGPIRCWSTF